MFNAERWVLDADAYSSLVWKIVEATKQRVCGRFSLSSIVGFDFFFENLILIVSA